MKLKKLLSLVFVLALLASFTQALAYNTLSGFSSYTFSAVTSSHTLSAAFGKTSGVAGAVWKNPFKDVAEGDWFYDAVQYVAQRGLMTGTAADLFGPNDAVTRGMAVTILWRMSGDKGRYANTFNDVAAGSYYETAAAWASSKGIASGTGGGRFEPDAFVTRQDLAVMLWRYAKLRGMDVSVGEDTNILSYDDAITVSEYAYAALQWACGSGLLHGDTSNHLNPRGTASRAETAAILQRFAK
jgi:hypothetical protein